MVTQKFSICSIREWDERVFLEILEGISLTFITANSYRLVLSQTESIEQEHPRYLNYLFCDVIIKKGSNSGFKELAAQMVLSSMSTIDARPSINIITYQLRICPFTPAVYLDEK